MPTFTPHYTINGKVSIKETPLGAQINIYSTYVEVYHSMVMSHDIIKACHSRCSFCLQLLKAKLELEEAREVTQKK